MISISFANKIQTKTHTQADTPKRRENFKWKIENKTKQNQKKNEIDWNQMIIFEQFSFRCGKQTEK